MTKAPEEGGYFGLWFHKDTKSLWQKGVVTSSRHWDRNRKLRAHISIASMKLGQESHKGRERREGTKKKLWKDCKK